MIEKYFYYYDRKYRITENGDIFRCEYKDVRVQKYNNITNILKRTNKELQLKYYIDRDGYANCNLISKYEDKHYSRHFRVHHLVYLIFIKNIVNIDNSGIGYEENNNYIQINHIDGNKLNNHYTNLELITLQENINHAVVNKLHNSQIKAKYVEIYKFGNYIDTVWKTREVTKYIKEKFNVNIDTGTISRRARDGKETHGFTFKYKV